MSSNEAMDRSIRAKLVEANKEYGIFNSNELKKDCWDYHARVITGKGHKRTATGSKSHELWLEFYRSLPLTPDELRYINENISTEAWARLGLKLPEKKLEYTIPTDLSPEVVAWLEASVNAGKCKYHGTFTHNTDVLLSCKTTCHKWTGRITCSPKPEYLEMFKTILDAQLPPLNYTVPDLNAEEREHVGVAAKCLEESCNGNCPACEPIMGKIFDASRCYLIQRSPGSPERAQIIDALKDVREQQKPLLPQHNVVQFAEPEYGNWEWWIKGKEIHQKTTCPGNRTQNYDDKTKDRCDEHCKKVFLEVGESCPCHKYPQEAVRTIIEQCIALGPKEELPPHNLDKLPQPQYDALKTWRAGSKHLRAADCPRSHSGAKWESCEDCRRIFPELVHNRTCSETGPCATYGDEKVCAVVDKLLALGPKFEECDAWWKDSEKKERVDKEDDGYYHLIRGGWVKKTHMTLTPPPPKEEFQPYVAIWKGFDRVEIVTVLEKRGGDQALTTLLANDVQQILHTSNLTPIANPLKCRDMLNVQLGEESMVEEIKAMCEKRIGEWQTIQPEDPHGMGYTSACAFILKLIAKGERKAKCKE